ncbi:MAG: Rhodanese-related sulfurtransferase [Candidatus Saccharibacteria bacterium GW2011_GWC2_48_9]|nr:MAG: Rhodanese-related sulfurtransferase [Candidatus Saccharibacteria bacterium GW2011_GWC2_48_9]
MSMNRIIIDVREPYEYEAGHVDGALNIPPAELLAGARQLDGVAKDAELVLYCKTGSRSNVGIQILQNLGFTNLVNGLNAGQVEKKYNK